MPLRYVILEHTMPADSLRGLHWDLMLEDGDSLETWALTTEPMHGVPIAERLPAHRLAYLDYEGPVSFDRGSVRRIDQGTFERVSASEGRLTMILSGGDMAGRLTMTRLPGDPERWQLQFSRNEGR